MLHLWAAVLDHHRHHPATDLLLHHPIAVLFPPQEEVARRSLSLTHNAGVLSSLVVSLCKSNFLRLATNTHSSFSRAAAPRGASGGTTAEEEEGEEQAV